MAELRILVRLVWRMNWIVLELLILDNVSLVDDVVGVGGCPEAYIFCAILAPLLIVWYSLWFN